jgi:hypothetical protein
VTIPERQLLPDVLSESHSCLLDDRGEAGSLPDSHGRWIRPVSGPSCRNGAGALDTFVVDRIFKNSGPAFFLNNLYPSIFGR